MSQDLVKDRYLMIEKVAEILDCGERHVRNLIIEKKLTAVKIGSRAIRISESSLISFLESARVEPDDLYEPPDEEMSAMNAGQPARSRWMMTK